MSGKCKVVLFWVCRTSLPDPTPRRILTRTKLVHALMAHWCLKPFPLFTYADVVFPWFSRDKSYPQGHFLARYVHRNLRQICKHEFSNVKNFTVFNSLDLCAISGIAVIEGIL